ncbi:PREDICTED: uncharacterized protein LOC108609527 [Drosophila arizonae]|uniref:Uncharacterized protein LOC108609527 n=1 Tax=Drosophila arizonae TaxID=7263 RepID=A0ABM1NP52_DROAR|nr:PREDICTED: uncharacterized protein LOC108609527 [Drosophila arizonae]
MWMYYEIEYSLENVDLIKTRYTESLKEPIQIKINVNNSIGMEPNHTRRYFVNSAKCKMPYADPFSPESMQIYKPAKLKVCTKQSDLFHLSFDRNTNRYSLHVNETILLPFGNGIECNYRGISQRKIHATVYFEKQHELPQNINGVIAQCHIKLNSSLIQIIQQDAFPLHQVTNERRQTPSKQPTRQPSVIILGLDSMSRMNFERTMPLTAKFVRQEGWYPLSGYNKMADNTFPNVYTVLSGVAMLDEHAFRWQKYRDTRMIWRDYIRAGYATAVTEDVISIPLFRQIYKTTPMPYNLRSLLLSIAETLKTYVSFGYDYCIGRRLAFSYVYDFCAQFITRHMLELDQPMFGFFWSCTFTHDSYNVATSLDRIFVDYLYLFEQLKLFDNSIVILLSDHGARFGKPMDLSDSFLEERLPLLHIYLPPWFRKAYPQYAHALAMNYNRLCSNYDLHNTLRHLLQLNATTPAMLPAVASCPSSQSLLHPLPVERSCEDACIVEHWCTCNEFVNVTIENNMRHLAEMIVTKINIWMLKNGFSKKCQRLLLTDVDKVEVKKSEMMQNIVTLRILFCTYPNVGKFRTTLKYNVQLKRIVYLDVPEISRINSYRTDAPCEWNTIARKFCFCYKKKTRKNTLVGDHRLRNAYSQSRRGQIRHF